MTAPIPAIRPIHRFARMLAPLFLAAAVAGCSDSGVADVSLGILTFKNIQLDAFVDPDIPGVTCHVRQATSPLN